MTKSDTVTDTFSQMFFRPLPDGGFEQMSRHSVRLSGNYWETALRENRTAVLESVLRDLEVILGLPQGTLTIEELRVGSLVIEFTSRRNASQTIPDDVINNLLMTGIFNFTQRTYQTIANTTETTDVLTAFTVKRSINPANTFSCGTSCIAGIVGGIVGGIILVIMVMAVVVRWRRQRRQRALEEEHAEPAYDGENRSWYRRRDPSDPSNEPLDSHEPLDFDDVDAERVRRAKAADHSSHRISFHHLGRRVAPHHHVKSSSPSSSSRSEDLFVDHVDDDDDDRKRGPPVSSDELMDTSSSRSVDFEEVVKPHFVEHETASPVKRTDDISAGHIPSSPDRAEDYEPVAREAPIVPRLAIPARTWEPYGGVEEIRPEDYTRRSGLSTFRSAGQRNALAEDFPSPSPSREGHAVVLVRPEETAAAAPSHTEARTISAVSPPSSTHRGVSDHRDLESVSVASSRPQGAAASVVASEQSFVPRAVSETSAGSDRRRRQLLLAAAADDAALSVVSSERPPQPVPLPWLSARRPAPVLDDGATVLSVSTVVRPRGVLVASEMGAPPSNASAASSILQRVPSVASSAVVMIGRPLPPGAAAVQVVPSAASGARRESSVASSVHDRSDDGAGSTSSLPRIQQHQQRNADPLADAPASSVRPVLLDDDDDREIHVDFVIDDSSPAQATATVRREVSSALNPLRAANNAAASSARQLFEFDDEFDDDGNEFGVAAFPASRPHSGGAPHADDVLEEEVFVVDHQAPPSPTFVEWNLAALSFASAPSNSIAAAPAASSAAPTVAIRRAQPPPDVPPPAAAAPPEDDEGYFMGDLADSDASDISGEAVFGVDDDDGVALPSAVAGTPGALAATYYSSATALTPVGGADGGEVMEDRTF